MLLKHRFRGGDFDEILRRHIDAFHTLGVAMGVTVR